MTDQMTVLETPEIEARKMSTQVFGLILMTGSLAVLLIASLVFQTGEAGPAALFVAVAGMLAWLVWRVNRLWSVIVGLVVTIAAVLGLFFLAFGIFQLFSPFEFISGLLFLFGVLFALGGGVRALRSRNRDAGPNTRSIRVRKGALVVMGVASLLSIGGFFMSRTTVGAAEAANASQLEMLDFEFLPTTPVVAGGQNLMLTNSDAVVHDFTLDDYDIQVRLVPGSETIVDLSALPPGTYQFYCSLHSDGGEGMVGTITLEG